MNELNDDLANHYDEETFRAFHAVRRNMLADEGDALRDGLADHVADIWRLLQAPNTHVYLSGMHKVAAALDALLAAADSAEAWQALKQRLIAERR